MEESTTNFKNFMYLKDQLLHSDTKDMIDIYQEYSQYEAFVYATVDLINHEAPFLLFDESFAEKIRDILVLHRFDAEDDVKESVNDIIVFLNEFMALKESDKLEITHHYLNYQEAARMVIFKDYCSLIYSLGYDCVVLDALEEGDTTEVTEDPYTLMSINYLVNCCPNLFLDNKIRDTAIDKLESINSKSILKRHIKSFSGYLKDNIQKVKNKEE